MIGLERDETTKTRCEYFCTIVMSTCTQNHSLFSDSLTPLASAICKVLKDGINVSNAVASRKQKQEWSHPNFTFPTMFTVFTKPSYRDKEAVQADWEGHFYISWVRFKWAEASQSAVFSACDTFLCWLLWQAIYGPFVPQTEQARQT